MLCIYRIKLTLCITQLFVFMEKEMTFVKIFSNNIYYLHYNRALLVLKYINNSHMSIHSPETYK